jgi:hypothetical protein
VDKIEVLPVPPEYVSRVWKNSPAIRNFLSQIPGYDIERLHGRLLSGMDRLWIAPGPGQLYGVIITTVLNKPPQQRKAFLRKDRALMKSLLVHFVGGYGLTRWIDSASERIKLYARQQGCRMLFVQARRGWHTHLYHRWYSPEWEVVALGRDRPTVSKCRRLARRNTPGYFRLLIPVPAEKFNRYMYAFQSTCRFRQKEEAA